MFNDGSHPCEFCYYYNNKSAHLGKPCRGHHWVDRECKEDGPFYKDRPSNHFKSKGNKMKVLPKILRRAIVVWCLYGLYEIVLLVHPFVRTLALASYERSPEIYDNKVDAITSYWLLCISAVFIFVAGSYGVHKFSAWLFNENK